MLPARLPGGRGGEKGGTFSKRSESLTKRASPAEEIALAHIPKTWVLRGCCCCYGCSSVFPCQVHPPHPSHISEDEINFLRPGSGLFCLFLSQVWLSLPCTHAIEHTKACPADLKNAAHINVDSAPALSCCP